MKYDIYSIFCNHSRTDKQITHRFATADTIVGKKIESLATSKSNDYFFFIVVVLRILVHTLVIIDDANVEFI